MDIHISIGMSSGLVARTNFGASEERGGSVVIHGEFQAVGCGLGMDDESESTTVNRSTVVG